jgi:hypothetical protein
MRFRRRQTGGPLFNTDFENKSQICASQAGELKRGDQSLL